MDNLGLIQYHVRHISIDTIYSRVRDGHLPVSVGDVLIETHKAVERDFIRLLDIQLARRRDFICMLAKEIYLQWVECGIIQEKQA